MWPQYSLVSQHSDCRLVVFERSLPRLRRTGSDQALTGRNLFCRFVCRCGNPFSLAMNWPRFNLDGQIWVSSLQCIWCYRRGTLFHGSESACRKSLFTVQPARCPVPDFRSKPRVPVPARFKQDRRQKIATKSPACICSSRATLAAATASARRIPSL